MTRSLTGAVKRIASGRTAVPAEPDAGVIAIVVALSVSTFLLGFAALAVDVGVAYTQKAQVQSVADRLAVAGAGGLPAIRNGDTGALDRMAQALTGICADAAVPGICPADPGLTWATDGNDGNGEVSFLTDPDGDGDYSLANRVFGPTEETGATALKVRLPPSTVEFGLAGTFGRDSAVIKRSASARVGTPLGAGVLPFALTETDLDEGQFCVRDPLAARPPGFPGRVGLVDLRIVSPTGDLVYGTEDQPLTVELIVRRGGRTLIGEVFHLTNTSDPVPYETRTRLDRDRYRYTLLLPVGVPVAAAQIWATGTQTSRFFGPSPFTSEAGDLTYSGLPPTDTLCQEPRSDRGFVQLGRPGGTTNQLQRNIRSSPAVNLMPVGGLLGALGDTVNCAATRFAEVSSCLAVVRGQPFSTALTSGLLDSADNTPGRLVGDCGNGTSTVNGHGGVDSSRLFTSAGLVDINAGGASAGELKNRITSGTPADADGRDRHGWLTSKVLQCPRLAVMPVVDEDSLIGLIGGQEITGFRYVWIDDDTTARGLNWSRGEISSFRGYVLDPGYLPQVVSRSAQVGPFLGSDMPKEALLITDLTD